eukprot:6530603-Pyramimonas_sp.AAC.1
MDYVAQGLHHPFPCQKTSGALRIVWDCRGNNSRFRATPAMGLASGSRWADVSVPADVESHVDIPNLFYFLGIPCDLSEHFALSPIEASLVADFAERLGFSMLPLPGA